MPSHGEDFELQRNCVVSIQGGGALGIELIGQLQGVVGESSLGDRQMDFQGISGTSAGAIIAVLLWVGYSPFAIRDIVKTTFSDAEREAFFGRFDPREVRSFAKLLAYMKRVEAALHDAPKAAGPWRRGWTGLHKWSTRLWLLPSLINRLRWVWRKMGVLDADGFEARIDTLLRASKKFEGQFDDVSRHLTFADIAGKSGLRMVPLFLMVTDVARRQLVVVSSIDLEHCGQFSIARAVRASAGFPVFFRPVRLGPHLACIDGGVISNAPSWVFARAFREQLRQAGEKGDAQAARLAASPWHHVALRLPPEPKPDANAPLPDLGGLGFIKALASLLSGIGRRTLEDTMFALVTAKGFIVEPPMPPAGTGPAGVLDFNALTDSELVDASFRRGREAAWKAIEVARFATPDPAAIGPVLVDLVLMVTEIMQPYLKDGTVIRANVFLPVSASRTHMRIAYAVNMAGDRDVEIEVSALRSVTSLCFALCRPLLANLADKSIEPPLDVAGAKPFAPMTEHDRTWLLSVPILDTVDMRPRLPDEARALALDFDGPVFGVLNVDASVLYDADGLDREPAKQARHPAVRATFDAMKIAALRVGMLMNQAWL